MKKLRTFFKDVQNVQYILSDTYFCPVSKVTKKEKPLDLNLVEPSEAKSLAFLLSL